jgi:uncharacterized membrane protein
MSAYAAASGHAAQTDAIEIRKISTADLRVVLRKGLEDYWARPSHMIFLALVYPVVGFALSRLAFGYNMIPMLFPLIAGFALVGPIAALGMYELSRRIERGEKPSVRDAFAVIHSPSIGAIGQVGVVLLGLFFGWLLAAYTIYQLTLGPELPSSLGTFATAVFTTAPGWTMIIAGDLVGIAFAAVAMALSVISLPMLLDGERSARVAVRTSVRVVLANPEPMALWGLIVVALLALGSVPLFVGLLFVLPILGHATWHLYRRTVKR